MGDVYDIQSRFIVWQARERGNLDYLTAYLAQDGTPITREIRDLVVEIVRGDFKRPRRRPDKSMVRDAELMDAVLKLELQSWPRTAAIRKVHEDSGESESTIKRALRDEKPPWWDEALEECAKAGRTVGSTNAD